jgi:uncharacterized membrane protein/DNA-directed RNA polymerase specialized sigma24 family protein
MKSREWSEINRQCLEIFALERAAREGIGAMEASLPAAYERLNTALRPIVSEMVRMLIQDAREAERLTNAFLERLPLILPIHADTEFACEHWMGAVLIEFVYHAASLPRESLHEHEARLLQELAAMQPRQPLSAEERELIDRVRQALSPDEFLAWYDYVVNGYTPTEIAALHREPVSTVEETLQRARRKLWEATTVDATLRTRVDVLGQRLTWLGTPRAYPHSSVAHSVADDGTVVGVAFSEEYRYSDTRGNYPVYIACAFRWQPYQFETLGELGRELPAALRHEWRRQRRVRLKHRMLAPLDTASTGYGATSRDGYIHAVNADGKVLVGEQDGRAVQWNHDAVEVLAQDNPSAAYGVSADGKYIVGHIRHQAVRWDVSGAIQRLGTLEGGQSEARAVSRDGTVVVGKSDGRAFRWTPNEGMCALRQADEDISQAHSVSYDGTRIVGEALDEQSGLCAFLWTPEDGMQDLNVLFAHLRATGEVLERAYAISPNGRYIVGEGYCPETDRREAFVLDLGEFSY